MPTQHDKTRRRPRIKPIEQMTPEEILRLLRALGVAHLLESDKGGRR